MARLAKLLGVDVGDLVMHLVVNSSYYREDLHVHDQDPGVRLAL